MCVAGFDSNFGQDTDYPDTVSIGAVSNFKKILRLYVKFGYVYFFRFPIKLLIYSFQLFVAV